MFTDMFGKKRAKLGLHVHTNLSDGRRSPEEVARIYKSAGYDMIALTDHWRFGKGGEIEGLKILSGCEYNFGEPLNHDPVYHIVGLGMTQDPTLLVPDLDSSSVPDTPSYVKANRMIDAIRRAGGLADIAHPAWSVNDTKQIENLVGIEATEIYNTVSDCADSNRPYSGCVIDSLASEGISYPLLAVDDSHFYNGDECVSYIMAEVDDLSADSVLSAIRERRFYATQGPEVHLTKEADGSVTLKCSPVSKIVFMSNRTWGMHRMVRGEGLTSANYSVSPGENFVRVEVTDADGKCAWTNIIITG